MKKIFISLLGIAGYLPSGKITRVSYSFDNSLKEKFGNLKKQKYPNMLPLVIENFKDYEHICIYTSSAKEVQQNILDSEKIDFEIKDNGIYIPSDKETDYSYFLKQLNKIIDEDYDKVIIDVTHGFRHMPILSIFTLFNQYIKNNEKIEHIFFTKEIVLFKEYKIIDLKENFEAINFSFLLSSFNNNYTVPSNLQFKNIDYQELVYKLSKFSEYFSSNLKQLLESSLIDEIIDNAKSIVDTDLENVNSDILILIDNMKYIHSLKGESEWIRFYEFSKLMNSINNQLNAVMFLNDAVGFYCLDSLNKIDEVSKYIKKYKNKIKSDNSKYSIYRLINDTKNFIKYDRNNRSFIYTDNLAEIINKYLKTIPELSYFQNFIKKLESLRNNMIHSSVSPLTLPLDNIKRDYLSLLYKFEIFCIKKDILSPIKKDTNTYLEAIKINNYFSIKEMEIEDLKDKKEIYFVGENGDGKTILLQAIALALKGNFSEYSLRAKEYIDNKTQNKMNFSTKCANFPLEYKKYKKVKNLFAYGINRNKIYEDKKDNSGYSGLFDTPHFTDTTYLGSPKDFLKKENTIIDDFVTKIKNLLENRLEIIRTKDKVEFRENSGDLIEFEMLSEGYKTTLIWLCDLLSRLMVNQKEIKKLEDFQAIVLIDEVDLYLHPKWKYEFMYKLRKIFQKIQFIMTTHSIVTVLGASDDAVFYKIYKEDGDTKVSQQINDISYYTSDILMSSPLFNLNKITVRNYKDKLSSDDYVYHRIHKKIKKRIQNISIIQDDEVDSWLDEEFAKEFSE